MLRKTVCSWSKHDTDRIASMRPQRNAAENAHTATDAQIAVRASMRPQRNAAENQSGGLTEYRMTHASMRPQRNAAENIPALR